MSYSERELSMRLSVSQLLHDDQDKIGNVHFHLLGTNDFHVMARKKDLLMWVVLAIAVVIS